MRFKYCHWCDKGFVTRKGDLKYCPDCGKILDNCVKEVREEAFCPNCGKTMYKVFRAEAEILVVEEMVIVGAREIRQHCDHCGRVIDVSEDEADFKFEEAELVDLEWDDMLYEEVLKIPKDKRSRAFVYDGKKLRPVSEISYITLYSSEETTSLDSLTRLILKFRDGESFDLWWDEIKDYLLIPGVHIGKKVSLEACL